MMKRRLVVCLSALMLASPLSAFAAESAGADEYITGWRFAKIKTFTKAGAFREVLTPDKLPTLRTRVVDRGEPALLGIKVGNETVYVMQAQVIWTGSVCPTGYVTVAVASGHENAGHNAGSSSGSGGCKPSTGGPR
jgi:hypothetical protein